MRSASPKLAEIRSGRIETGGKEINTKKEPPGYGISVITNAIEMKKSDSTFVLDRVSSASDVTVFVIFCKKCMMPKSPNT